MTEARFDVVVIGSGIAGLTAALSIDDRSVAVLTAGEPGRDGSSHLAQGGLAAALAPDDSPSLHAQDTIRAAQGLTFASRVDLLTSGAPAAIRWLGELGVCFDRQQGHLALAMEAAHSRARVVHAGGDASGSRIMSALRRRAETAPHIQILEHHLAEELAIADGRVVGAWVRDPGQQLKLIQCAQLVLATGGSAGLWARSTNPETQTGTGLALALEAGARTRHLEFVQFHPTALDVAGTGHRLPLVTEALRGAGARLVDGSGRPFMQRFHPAGDLAPRNIVALAIHSQQREGPVFLDASDCVGDAFPIRFPTVHAACLAAGIDPCSQPIPVTPAAHYHMGGIEVDSWGRSSVAGLWCCGEAASSGVHGANRLASNSLIEGVVFGRRLASAILSERRRTSYARPDPRTFSASSGDPAPLDTARRILWDVCGLERRGSELSRGLDVLEALLAVPGQPFPQRAALIAAQAILNAAAARRQSLGAHLRSDAENVKTA